MNQIQFEDGDAPAAVGSATKGEMVDDSGSNVTSFDRKQLMQSTYQPTYHPQSTWIEPSQAGSSSNEARQLHERRVGARYLLQFALTTIPLVIVDLALLTGAIVAAREVLMYFSIGTGIDISASFVPIAIGFLIVAAELGLYPGIRLNPVEEFRRLAVAITAMFVMWTIGVVLLEAGQLNQPIFLAVAYVFSLSTVPVFRNLARRVLAWLPWWGFPTLVCGDDPVAMRVYHWIASNPRIGLRPIGVIGDVDGLGAADEPCYAGSWASAHEVACQKGAYWAVVVPSDGYSNVVATRIAEHLGSMPFIQVLSEPLGTPEYWSPHRELDGLTGVHLQQNLMLPLPRITKRLLDLSAALLGGILLLPLLFYIAVAVKLSSRGPILYGHERLGRGGRRFRAWKFRSMFQSANQVLEHYLEQHPEFREEWEQDHKLRYDPRVTRIGRFIRKTSLDELPQLWNVIRGEMSLVGPRPIVTEEIEKYGPYYELYALVKPGITGLWQVSGRNNTTYDERVQLDAYYVRNWSPWLDLYLLLRTIRIVLFAKGAY